MTRDELRAQVQSIKIDRSLKAKLRIELQEGSDYCRIKWKYIYKKDRRTGCSIRIEDKDLPYIDAESLAIQIGVALDACYRHARTHLVHIPGLSRPGVNPYVYAEDADD